MYGTWISVVRGRLVCGAGTALPKGRAAIGWRVGVYWRDDAVFYAAEIIGFDTGSGRHQVLYDDGAEDFPLPVSSCRPHVLNLLRGTWAGFGSLV